MNRRKAGLGDTWASYYGSRGGIQVRQARPRRSVEPVRIRTSWSGAESGADFGKSSAPEPGYYKEKGPWVYEWNPKRASIALILSPTQYYGSVNTLSKSSKAWKAIYANIVSGKAKYLGRGAKAIKVVTKLKAQVESNGGGNTDSAQDFATRAASVSKTYDVPADEPPDVKTGGVLDKIPSWLPWAAGGVAAALVIGAIAMGGSRTAAPHMTPALRANRRANPRGGRP